MPNTQTGTSPADLASPSFHVSSRLRKRPNTGVQTRHLEPARGPGSPARKKCQKYLHATASRLKRSTYSMTSHAWSLAFDPRACPCPPTGVNRAWLPKQQVRHLRRYGGRLIGCDDSTFSASGMPPRIFLAHAPSHRHSTVCTAMWHRSCSFACSAVVVYRSEASRAVQPAAVGLLAAPSRRRAAAL